jgi:hypothetical protein
MTKEALKLALEALEVWLPTVPVLIEKKKSAITAIKEALAQPNFCPRCGKRLGTNDWDIHTCTPPQRTWVGLTDEDNIDWEEGGNLKDLVKAIEAKLKDKNT